VLTDAEKRILSLVRENHGISRKELAESLNLSKPAVSVAVSRLIEKGFVREAGILKVKNKRAGRYPIKLEFVPDALYIVGIDLGGSKLEAVLSDLDGRIVKSHRTRLKGCSVQELYTILESVIENLIDGVNTNKLLGIGVGVAGTVDRQTHMVRSFPAFNVTNWDLKDLLEQRFGVQVLLANDVTLDALAEYKMGAGKGINSLLLVSIGTGIGAGMILEGRVHEGFHGQAGEIGWFVTDWISEKKEEKTLFGPLEKRCSGYWLERKLQNLTGEKDLPKLFELSKVDSKVCRFLEEAFEHLALAIAGSIVLFDPGVVVLKGGLGYNQYEFIERIIMRVFRRVLPSEFLEDLILKKGAIKEFGVARGATFLVQERLLAM